jgi:hypothetical protein
MEVQGKKKDQDSVASLYRNALLPVTPQYVAGYTSVCCRLHLCMLPVTHYNLHVAVTHTEV